MSLHKTKEKTTQSKEREESHHRLRHFQEAQIKCREIYNEYRHNYDNFFKYQKKLETVPVYILGIFFTLFVTYLSTTTSQFIKIVNYIPLIFSGIFIGIVIYVVYNKKKKKEFTLTNKEVLIFRLCGVANYILNFVSSETHTRDKDRAQILNRRLIASLTPLYTRIPNIHVDRGLYFDKKFLKFIDLIKQLARVKAKKILEGKREDGKLKKLAEDYRAIAYYFYKEDFDNGIKYIQTQTQTSLRQEGKLMQMLAGLAAHNIFKWVLSILLTIAILGTIYLIANSLGLVSHEPVPIWGIWAVIGAIAAFIKPIKRLIDWIFERFSAATEERKK